MLKKIINSYEDAPNYLLRSQTLGDKHKRDIKMSYDLEFEKLIIMLKDQYHSLFEK